MNFCFPASQVPQINTVSQSLQINQIPQFTQASQFPQMTSFAPITQFVSVPQIPQLPVSNIASASSIYPVYTKGTQQPLVIVEQPPTFASNYWQSEPSFQKPYSFHYHNYHGTYNESSSILEFYY